MICLFLAKLCYGVLFQKHLETSHSVVFRLPVMSSRGISVACDVFKRLQDSRTMSRIERAMGFTRMLTPLDVILRPLLSQIMCDATHPCTQPWKVSSERAQRQSTHQFIISSSSSNPFLISQTLLA